jgi:hypothetical protein
MFAKKGLYMKKSKDKIAFFNYALKTEKNRISTSIFYRKNLMSPLWGFLVEYFIRFIDFKNYQNIVKLDLWDETVAKFTDIRKTILFRLKPKRLYYIEFVKEFCTRFKTLYHSKNEVVINDNILNWPFEKESLDAIIDVSTSDHLNLQDFDTVIGKYSNSLKRNGYLFLLHLNEEYFNIKNFLKRETGYPTFARDENTIDAIIRKHGFAIIKKRFYFPFLLDPYFSSQELYFRILFIGHLILGNLIFYLITYLLPFKKTNIFIGYLIKKY